MKPTFGLSLTENYLNFNILLLPCSSALQKQLFCLFNFHTIGISNKNDILWIFLVKNVVNVVDHVTVKITIQNQYWFGSTKINKLKMRKSQGIRQYLHGQILCMDLNRIYMTNWNTWTHLKKTPTSQILSIFHTQVCHLTLFSLNHHVILKRNTSLKHQQLVEIKTKICRKNK